MTRIVTALLIVSVCLLGACNSLPFLEDELEEKELLILVPRPFAYEFINYLPLADFITIFEDRYPEVKVKVEYFSRPTGDEEPVDLRQLMEDYRPDIVQLSAFSTHFYADHFLDLTSFVEIDEIDLSDFYPALIEGGTVHGSLKAIPAGYRLYPILYYNKHIFDAANLDYPTSDWTWEDAIEVSRTIELAHSIGDEQDRKIRGGIEYLPAYFAYIKPILLSYGVQLYSTEDWRAGGYLDSAETIEALQWMVDNIGESDMRSYDFNYNSFTNYQQLSMLFGNSSDIPHLNRLIKKFEHIGAVGLPRFEGRDSIHSFYLTSFGITQDTLHPELAWQFLSEFLIDNHELSQQVAQESFMSTRKSVSADAGIENHELARVVFEALENAHVSFTDWDIGVGMDMNSVGGRIFDPGDPPPTVLRQIASEWDLLLDELTQSSE